MKKESTHVNPTAVLIRTVESWTAQKTKQSDSLNFQRTLPWMFTWISYPAFNSTQLPIGQFDDKRKEEREKERRKGGRQAAGPSVIANLYRLICFNGPLKL